MSGLLIKPGEREPLQSSFSDASNPAGLDGVEFIEYSTPAPQALGQVLEMMGFKPVMRHRSREVMLYRQGAINVVVNAHPPDVTGATHGSEAPAISAIAFRVRDARAAYNYVLERGAWDVPTHAEVMELNIPAIHGAGGSRIYFVDRYKEFSIYDVDFVSIAGARTEGVGLTRIDHLTHNVRAGHMDAWASFYERIFGFREIRYFDIRGQHTGLHSRAMVSPCGKIRIPINEEGNEKAGQIQEYLDMYRGEGIQHVALGSADLFRTVDALKARGVKLLDTNETYYKLIDKRIPGHGENVAELKKRRILIDGRAGALLLQIFSENQLGPIFFEFIQRKGDEGFGEGNFKALFESIELDQMKRGVL